jgi:hypothetical protein
MISGELLPEERIISYIPILVEPVKDKVVLKYIMWIGICMNLDNDHMDREMLKVIQPLRSEEVIESGIKKYRDGVIPKHVHEDLSSGKCLKVILDYSTEGFWDIDFAYVSTIFGVEPTKLMWLSGIWNPKFLGANNEVTVIWRNFWECFVNSINERTEPNSLEYIFHEDRTINESTLTKGLRRQIQDIKDLKIRKYHGLSYNRQPRKHRLYVLTRLKSEGIIDRTAYSWGKCLRNDPHWEMVGLEREKASGYLTDKDDESFLEMINSPKVEFKNEDLTYNKADNINFDHIKDCYFQIINETDFENAEILEKNKQVCYENGIEPTPFLSEKSYKPFISGMPFVIFGQSGTVKALRRQGYDVYDNWINHDYDNIIDDVERFQAAMDETIRLSLIPKETWSDMLSDMLPYIESNIAQLNKNSIATRASTEFGKFMTNYDITGHTVRLPIAYPDPLVIRATFLHYFD